MAVGYHTTLGHKTFPEKILELKELLELEKFSEYQGHGVKCKVMKAKSQDFNIKVGIVIN